MWVPQAKIAASYRTAKLLHHSMVTLEARKWGESFRSKLALRGWPLLMKAE